ncbi:MAG: hypothetical protein JXR95_00955 [Deltaproteobacteria bacterium]|nr:hypothetical protein [Deltaproteobacteria bacterium]
MEQANPQTPMDQETEAKLKLSYMWPGIVFIIGLAVSVFNGTKPFEDYYKKNISWIPVKAQLQKVLIVTADGEKSIVSKQTNSVFRLKLVFVYSPRDLFGTNANLPDFPAWLKIPAKAFIWEKTEETWTTYMNAAKTQRHYANQREHLLYMNPEFPSKARYQFWENYLFTKIGIGIFAIGFVMLMFVMVVNGRAQKTYITEQDEAKKIHERRLARFNKKNQ